MHPALYAPYICTLVHPIYCSSLYCMHHDYMHLMLSCCSILTQCCLVAGFQTTSCTHVWAVTPTSPSLAGGHTDAANADNRDMMDVQAPLPILWPRILQLVYHSPGHLALCLVVNRAPMQFVNRVAGSLCVHALLSLQSAYKCRWHSPPLGTIQQYVCASGA